MKEIHEHAICFGHPSVSLDEILQILRGVTNAWNTPLWKSHNFLTYVNMYVETQTHMQTKL